MLLQQWYQYANEVAHEIMASRNFSVEKMFAKF